MDNDEEKDKIKTLEELKGLENHTSLLEMNKRMDNGIDKEKVTNTNLHWLPIGIALGSAMGVSTNQLSLWLSLGIILGLLLSFLSRKN
ncbi:hypothetical protein LZ578_09440 [Jeotgalibaca sp. MA1X17-3]|uniref:hypothetical protein n=1 Tax=Jeotgalibaca sp. MA1X17-3 TaxID=2908211 RepID=UPI001F24A015|nr:hypothetical protein [Jeotgalibaca sp. MA1X17-3]UJF15208.1 hypothetical protein LZ578_09440 [Jeotgalibaca sp. MA1X17-3]